MSVRLARLMKHNQRRERWREGVNGTELQLKAIFTSHLNSFTLVPPLTEGPGDAAVLRLLLLLLNEIGVGGGVSRHRKTLYVWKK